MTGIDTLDELQRRAEQATDWLLRLRDLPQDDQLLSQWLDWCAQHPDNLAEFRRTCDLWNAFDTQELQTLLAMPKAASPLPSNARRRRLRIGFAVAASLVVAVAAAWIARDIVSARNAVTRVTARAEQSTDTLPDGSRVELGASSRVTSHFSPEVRAVDIEKGEAFFHVAKDPARPFVVHAGRISARAVGTAFNVRTGATRTVVTVTEGLVDVHARPTLPWLGADTSPEARHALVGPGEQVVYDEAAGRLRLSQVDAEVTTSWREGTRTFHFVDEPLGDVVSYLDRYAVRQIVIRDKTLARRTFTGTVHYDRSDDWLLALEQAYPLTVVPIDVGTVLLQPKEAAQASAAQVQKKP